MSWLVTRQYPGCQGDEVFLIRPPRLPERGWHSSNPEVLNVRKAFVGLIGLTLVSGVAIAIGSSAGAAAPAAAPPSGEAVVVDDLPNPMES